MNDIIETAKAPGVFSLDKFLVDIAYPVEEITVYTDAYSVNEKLKLAAKRVAIEDKIAKAEKAKRDEKRTSRTIDEVHPVDNLMSELEALQLLEEKFSDKIERSALKIELRGMAPHVVETISKKYYVEDGKDYSNTTEENERDFELIARSIIKIVDADGNENVETLNNDEIKKLKGSLLSEEYAKIIRSVAHVNLNGALFEQATDASFLSRRSDVAGE